MGAFWREDWRGENDGVEDDGSVVDWSSLVQEECSGAGSGVGEWRMGTVGSGGGANSIGGGF